MRETESESPPGEACTINFSSFEGNGPDVELQPENEIPTTTASKAEHRSIPDSIDHLVGFSQQIC